MYEETTMSEFEIITENDYDKLLNAYIKIYDSYVFDEFSFSSGNILANICISSVDEANQTKIDLFKSNPDISYAVDDMREAFKNFISKIKIHLSEIKEIVIQKKKELTYNLQSLDFIVQLLLDEFNIMPFEASVFIQLILFIAQRLLNYICDNQQDNQLNINDYKNKYLKK